MYCPTAHDQVKHDDLDGGQGDEHDQDREHWLVVAESDGASWNLGPAKQETIDALVAANLHDDCAAGEVADEPPAGPLMPASGGGHAVASVDGRSLLTISCNRWAIASKSRLSWSSWSLPNPATSWEAISSRPLHHFSCCLAAKLGQCHQGCSPVVRVQTPVDETARLQSVDQSCDIAWGDVQCSRQRLLSAWTQQVQLPEQMCPGGSQASPSEEVRQVVLDQERDLQESVEDVQMRSHR